MANMTMADWQTLSERINRVAPSATLAVDSKAKAMKAEGIDVIGFGAGEPNFPTPAAIVAAAAEAVQDPKNYRYTPTAGLPELRKAIADKTLRDSGYGVDPNQVIVTNGGKQAVYESFQILLNDGDEVIIPTPYWTSYPEAVKLAGGVPVEVFAGADRNFEPSLEDLEAARTERTKAIIVNTPNNPTGAVWNPETVKAFLRIPATVARESCRRIGDLYQDAAKRGVDAPEAPDEETLGLIDQEHRALFFLSALFLGQFPGKTQPGWAGVPLVKWLADSIPGNLFEKSPDFAAGTEEAAMQNFILIFSNVYSKFATFEQLMKRFNQPVNESDFEGMLDVFAKLVSGASKSVELPEAFQHMDFSGEPEKEA